MKTLAYVFDVEKLSEPELHQFFDRLLEAQAGLPLGTCKYSVFDVADVEQILAKHDELRDPDGHEIEPKEQS